MPPRFILRQIAGLSLYMIQWASSFTVPNNLKYVPDKKAFIVQSWSNFQNFIYGYDPICEELLDIALDETTWQVDTTNPKKVFNEMFDELPDAWQDKILKIEKDRIK